jgi:hypothetical protein
VHHTRRIRVATSGVVPYRAIPLVFRGDRAVEELIRQGPTTLGYFVHVFTKA